MAKIQRLVRCCACALGLAATLPATAQKVRVDHGKQGVWYFSSQGIDSRHRDNDDAPQLEQAGDARKAPASNIAVTLAPATVIQGAYASYQVNVDAFGRNILNDAANEPSLAVDPTNTSKIVVGWRQFDNVTSNFRQAGNAYSLTGGTSWRNNTVFTPGTFRSDPVLGVDAAGKFFYNSLQSTFFTDQFGTTNSGASWKLLGPATGGDKQWMVVDRTNSIGKGNQYQAWSTAGNNYGGRQFSRSTNGGSAWIDPVFIPNFPVWGTMDVASNGDLYLGGLGDTSFLFCRSTNAKDKNVTPSFDLSVPVDLGGAIVYAADMNPAGLLGQLWIATDRSSGPNAGNIYMLCSVGVDSANPCDVNFSRSTDGGKTWSKWIRVNDDLPNKGATHWFGALSVAPNGRLDACWYDNRANPSTNKSALFATSSYDGGKTWVKSVQVSPSFDPNIGYPNQNKMGDYLGICSFDDGARIAYAATFNQEEDVWFVKVPPVGGSFDAVSVSPYVGTLISGSTRDVWASDFSYYTLSSTRVLPYGDMAGVTALFNTGASGAGSLNLRIDATTSVPTTGMVWLFNWTTSRYDLVGSTPLSPSVKSVLISNPKAASPYISASQQVKAVFRAHKPVSSAGSVPFTLSIDQLQLAG